MPANVNLPSPGQLREFLDDLKNSRTINRDKLVSDMSDLIHKIPLTRDQVAQLSKAIASRVIYKTCYKCGKVKEECLGSFQFVDNDMSKPKRWVCGDC